MMNNTIATSLVFLSCITASSILATSLSGQEAGQIFDATGIKGGMVVHLGCGDGALTADLYANPSYRVQGLAFSEAELRQARATIQRRKLYGEKVSVTLCPATHLPYRTDMVQLLVAEDLKHISQDEVMRVLSPNGAAYLKEGDDWRTVRKAWPADKDEWTHYFYAAANNPVSQDLHVGPPTEWQWTAGPWYSREHEFVSSANALVSANGRVFSVHDRDADLTAFLPADWRLVARDAFSGVLLWERKIPKWINSHYRLKYGPAQLPRRLVAVGDRVYFTPAIDAPLTELDAATGTILQSYQGTAPTDEIIYEDGVLYLVNIPNATDVDLFQKTIRWNLWKWTPSPRIVMAVDSASGQILWTHENSVIPLTLTAGGGRVYFFDGARVVGLDRKTGQNLWESPELPRNERMTPDLAPRLAYYDEMVYFAGAESIGRRTGGSSGTMDSIHGLSAKTGERVWTMNEHPASGFVSPEDLYIAQGLIWFGCNMSKNDSGITTGLDPKTGKIVKQFPDDSNDGGNWHHRCHPGKATENFLISSWGRGTEYIDIETEHWNPTVKWLRGACLYGMMPANGFSYFLPNPCQCNPEGQAYGYNALSVARPPATSPVPDEQRLSKGPAFGSGQEGHAREAAAQTWPTYRCVSDRRGATPMTLAQNLRVVWSTELGGTLTPPTIAQGKLFVASPATHEVIALDAQSGKESWRFLAGGPVDSPPTVHKGIALFGSRDGYAYALRASDGALAWKFLAAEHDERMLAFEQVESVWPLHGSVLVDRDMAYLVAGRSMYADNGLTFYQLNPLTGELLLKKNFSAKDGKNTMRNIFPDILSSSADRVYMRASWIMDATNHLALVGARDAAGVENHLCAPNGFLDRTAGQGVERWRGRIPVCLLR